MMMENESGPPAFVRPGALVWYEARPGVTFKAVVQGEPRPFGVGWVVSLDGLGDEYTAWSGGERRSVAAVATWALTPREEELQP